MTQQEAVIRHINENGYITSAEAMSIYGISQLATRVFELKRKGYLFKKERVETTNRLGKKTYYDKYMLMEESDFEV